LADPTVIERPSRRWEGINASLACNPSCPKLKSYWHFESCRYEKNAATCAEPAQIASCPLPALPLRNGHLHQMAYSLFLFIRDVANGDLVAWIDSQLDAADNPDDSDRLESMRAALLEPLRGIYGASDKVLNMALDCGRSAGAQFLAPNFYGASMPSTPMAPPVMAPTAASASSARSPPRSTPASLTEAFRKSSHASCSTPFGAIAPGQASTSATATTSTIGCLAPIAFAGSMAAVIELYYTLYVQNSQKCEF
jgi:hypothetical protein